MAEAVLESLVELDKLEATSNSTRVGNLDQFQNDLSVCRIAILSPLSRLRDGTREIEFDDEFENFAAAVLAMHHFNTGNGSIISELEGIQERCPVRFTTELIDTEHSESVAVEQVIRIVSRTKNKPCAFLGSTRSSVCIPTAIITGIKGYPQFSPECTSPQLKSPEQFPLFGRLINADDGTAFPVLKWLQQRGRIDHLGILYRDDSYGTGYARALQNTAKEYMPGLVVELVMIPYEGATEDDFDRVVQQLQDTQFRFFFGIISRSLHYDTLMTKAYQAGIAGNGEHTWIFSESLGSKLLSREFPVGSPLHLATKGIGVITPVGGSPGTPIYKQYSKAIQELDNPHDLEYLKNKLPVWNNDTATNQEDYRTHLSNLRLGSPTETFSSLGYDTIAAMGLAACNVSLSGNVVDGSAHFNAIVNHPFKGISGEVVLDSITGSRDPESAIFNIINFVEGATTISEDGESVMSFEGIVTDVFEDGTWVNMEPYMFNDGSTTAPLDLPPQELDYNHIGTPLRAVLLTMAVVVLLSSTAFAIWTFWKRNSRVVRASQPIFLSLICLGTFLMGLSIIPLSIDDEIVSVKGCTIACMSTWWLVAIGFPIAFSALVTKTNRIVRIVSAKNFQRVAISARDVVVPMLVFIGVNVLILTLWTILSPLQWSREVMSEDTFGRPNESYGYCQSSGALPYVIAICAVNLGCLVVGVAQAYKARHLSTDFAESEYIAMAMALLLAVGFIAIPVTILAEDNPRAFVFVVTAVIFLCSMSLLLLIFVPKLASIRQKGLTISKSTQRSSRFSINMRPSIISGINLSSEDLSTLIGSSTIPGVACINKEELLPVIERENKSLRRLTGALGERIKQLEDETLKGNASGAQRLLLMSFNSKHDVTSEEGIIVHNTSEELKDAQTEHRKLRLLRRELEQTLAEMEREQPRLEAASPSYK